MASEPKYIREFCIPTTMLRKRKTFEEMIYPEAGVLDLAYTPLLLFLANGKVEEDVAVQGPHCSSDNRVDSGEDSGNDSIEEGRES